MFVDVFIKGLRANPFSESLIRIRVDYMTEILSRALSYLEVEEVKWCKDNTKKWRQKQEDN